MCYNRPTNTVSEHSANKYGKKQHCEHWKAETPSFFLSGDGHLYVSVVNVHLEQHERKKKRRWGLQSGDSI